MQVTSSHYQSDTTILNHLLSTLKTSISAAFKHRNSDDAIRLLSLLTPTFSFFHLNERLVDLPISKYYNTKANRQYYYISLISPNMANDNMIKVISNSNLDLIYPCRKKQISEESSEQRMVESSVTTLSRRQYDQLFLEAATQYFRPGYGSAQTSKKTTRTVC